MNAIVPRRHSSCPEETRGYHHLFSFLPFNGETRAGKSEMEEETPEISPTISLIGFNRHGEPQIFSPVSRSHRVIPFSFGSAARKHTGRTEMGKSGEIIMSRVEWWVINAAIMP